MRIRPCLAALLVTLITFGATAQDSELEPSMVFFELYMRAAPPTKTASYVKSVQQEIQQHRKYSLLSRSDAYTRIQTIMVTPAKRVNDEKLLAIEKMVAEGDKLIYTNPKKAIEVLRKAKVQLKEIVENISLDTKIRKDYFTTQMLLVRSHMDNGNEAKAKEIMGEIVRTFEDEYPVDTSSYHPKVVNLYKGVFVDLKDHRTATLTISTNPPGCDVYINGRAMKQKTPYTFTGLYPGSLSVNIRKGEMQSMVRKVTVPANGKGKVDIDLEYESAMSFSDDSFGLTFSNPESLTNNMLNYAVKLGKFLQVDYVVLSGVMNRGEGPALVGYQIDVKKRSILRQKDYGVKANVVSNRRIREMAAFLADVDPDAKPNVTYEPWYTNWIGWTAGGVGLVMGGVSLAFYLKFVEHKDNAEDLEFGSFEDRKEQANLGNDAQTTAGIFAGVAAASIVASVLVFTLVKFEDDTAADWDSEFAYPRTPHFIAAPVITPDGGVGLGAQVTF